MSNSAQRLHDLLGKVRGYAKKQTPTNKVWSQIFGFPESDRPLYLSNMGLFLALPDRVQKDMQEIEELSTDITLAWVPKLGEAMGKIQIEGDIRPFAQNISPEILYGLQVCSGLLDRRYSEKTLPDDEVTEISKKAEALYRDVIKADFSYEIKIFLLRNLRGFVDALTAYQITGAAGIQDQFDQAVGSMFTQQETWEKASKTKLGQRFCKFVGAVALLVNFSWNSIQISDHVKKQLALPPAKPAVGETVEEVTESPTSPST